jgi:hypothetical protein
LKRAAIKLPLHRKHRPFGLTHAAGSSLCRVRKDAPRG